MTDVFPNSKLHPLVDVADKRPWWPTVFPRRYHTQEGYVPIPVHAAVMGMLGYEEIPGAEARAMAVTCRAANLLASIHGAQYFWVTSALTDALLATREPDGPISETPWPFKGFTLLLPHGAFKTKRDGHMAWITVGVAGRNDDGSIDQTGDDCLFIHGSSITPSGALRDWTSYLRANLPVAEATGEQTMEVDQTTEENAEEVYKRYGWALEDMIQVDRNGFEDHSVLGLLVRLVLNACHYLANVPQALEESQRQTAKKARDTRPELWSPRWIGKHYARKQIIGGVPSGTHASPRMHWRRGHWRNQPVGEGRKDRRRTWIEPILVMAESAA